MLNQNKNDRGDLERPQPGNCGSQTLTLIPMQTNTSRRDSFQAQSSARNEFDANEAYYNSFDSSDSDKIESISTMSDSSYYNDRLNDEEEIRNIADMSRQLREERRLSKKGYISNDLESKLLSQPLPSKQEVEMFEDNPTKGLYFFILHTLLMSANCYAASAIFSLNPNVSVIQLTFSRGVIASLIMLALINVNLKKVLVDSVDRENLPSLLFRCVQGAFSIFISFMSLKFFNVSTVGIVCSLTPLIVCVIAAFLLNERMKQRDVLTLSGVFIAVILILVYANPQQAAAMSANPWALVALISQPFLLAGGSIAMRKMRKMPEQLCSAYQNLTLFVMASFAMVFSGTSLDFLWELSAASYGLLFLSCTLTIATQMAKFSAFKYSEAQPLQKYAFLPNCWQFFIDLLILESAFTGMQYFGFAILFAIYGGDVILGYLYSKSGQTQNSDDDFRRSTI